MVLGPPDGRVFMKVAAVGDTIHASQFNVPNAYVSAAYEGDLISALRAIGGDQTGVKLPPPLAAALTGDFDAFLDALNLGVLAPLAISGMETVDTGDGRFYEILLSADNGTCRARFDRSTFRLASLYAVVGQEGHQIKGGGTFEPTGPAELEEGLTFDAASRLAVPDFPTLEASGYPLGQEAPAVTIQALDGTSVALADLRGSAVVLDFWATWCVPCWGALEEIEEFAAWAETSGKPIAVYAVSTLEQTDGIDEQRARVRRFLTERDLGPPVLLDPDGSFFQAMHTPGLPSTVVIAPDGTLAHYHSGVPGDMSETLKAEVLQVLE